MSREYTIMPSVNYYNRSAPFWDFIASLEEQGQTHPMFGNRGDATDPENNNNNNDNEQANPWAQGWSPFPWGGPFAYRGRHGRHGPPPPHGHRGPAPPQHESNNNENEKEGEGGPEDAAQPSIEQQEAGPSARGPGGPSRTRSGCGSRGRGGWGGRGRGHHGHHGGPPRGFNPAMMGGFGGLAQMFQDQIFGGDGNDASSEDFKPEVDVFDTAEAFVVHISLPGAKKEDVGVNWDAEKSELSIAGVVYRPGDEEFLKTLAMNERKVGAFERKVRLGSWANPAQVDVDGISARMEDGVLTVEVPKLDSGYVEIKKVDIE